MSLTLTPQQRPSAKSRYLENYPDSTNYLSLRLTPAHSQVTNNLALPHDTSGTVDTHHHQISR